MNASVLKSLGQIAGIGGIALGVFLLLFKDLLRKLKVPGLKQEHWFRIVIMFMVLVWLIALCGIGGWIYIATKSPISDKKNPEIPVSKASDDEFRSEFDLKIRVPDIVKNGRVAVIVNNKLVLTARPDGHGFLYVHLPYSQQVGGNLEVELHVRDYWSMSASLKVSGHDPVVIVDLTEDKAGN